MAPYSPAPSPAAVNQLTGEAFFSGSTGEPLHGSNRGRGGPAEGVSGVLVHFKPMQLA
jgi:hypothetical protein